MKPSDVGLGPTANASPLRATRYHEALAQALPLPHPMGFTRGRDHSKNGPVCRAQRTEASGGMQGPPV